MKNILAVAFLAVMVGTACASDDSSSNGNGNGNGGGNGNNNGPRTYNTTGGTIGDTLSSSTIGDTISSSTGGSVGNTTATGGSVGDTVSYSKGGDAKATGGNSTAEGGKSSSTSQAASSSNQQNVNITNPSDVTQRITYSGTQTIRNVPNTTGIPLTSSNDTCMGSTSGSVAAPGIGLGFGTTWTDENCKMLKNSRELWNMGLKAAALALLCTDPRNKAAMEATGYECPKIDR